MADANGVFHAFWVDNRTGIAQAWTAPVTVNGKVVPHGAPELAGLDDVTADVIMHVGDAEIDPATKTVSGQAYLLNTSKQTINGPVVMRLLSTDFGKAQILNADNGKSGDGATWDFTSLLSGNKLAPGQQTGLKRIEFRVPDVGPTAQLPGITARVYGKVQSSQGGN